MEDRADDEIEVGRDPVAGHAHSFARRACRGQGAPKLDCTSAATNRRQNALDGTNIALLQQVQADARLSNAELGRRVGLSAPAVAEWLARLEEAGAIRATGAEPDPRARLCAERRCASGRRRVS